MATYVSLPVGYRRTYAEPLLAEQVFTSLEAAIQYANGENETLGAIAYKGQIISVVVDTTVTAYIIATANVSGTENPLKEIGAVSYSKTEIDNFLSGKASTTAVETAQGTADEAKSAAQAAQGTADEAKSAAQAAQGTADEAKSAAQAAQGTADAAKAITDKVDAILPTNIEGETLATESYVDDKVESLGNVLRLKGVLTSVEQLPTEGNEAGDVYLVPSEGGSNDVYDEYVWAVSDGTGSFEKFGKTQVQTDLSDYYKKSEVESLVESEVSSAKSEVTNNLTSAINNKVEQSTYNAKVAELEGAIGNKADASNVYTKEEIDNKGHITKDDLPVATKDTLGMVKVGSNLQIDEGGTLSAVLEGVAADTVNWSGVLNKPTIGVDADSQVELKSGANTFAELGIDGEGIKTTEQITVAMGSTSVGGYSTNDVIPVGTDIMSILKKLLVKRIAPTYTSPSLSLSSNPATTAEREVGASETVTITPTWNQNDAGAATKYTVMKGTETVLDQVSPGKAETTVVYADESVSIVGTVTYGDGERKPDNLGSTEPQAGDPNPIAGSSISKTLLFQGLRKSFYGCSENNLMELNSANIRSLSNSAFYAYNSTKVTSLRSSGFSFSVPSGTKKIVVAIPLTYYNTLASGYKMSLGLTIAGTPMAVVFKESTVTGVQGATADAATASYKVFHWGDESVVSGLDEGTLKVTFEKV